jgi:hypothetical protein
MSDKPQSAAPRVAPHALPESSEVSELIRDYARPLLYVDSDGPADMDTFRTSMMLAMICWNLPVYEAAGHPLYAQGIRMLEAVEKRVPAVVAAKLRALIEARKSAHAALPYLVNVEVTGSTLRDARIVAEARLLPAARKN